MRFELAELETFLLVVEKGSFSLAAKRLHVSQPSVTNRIKRLEATLRVKLLTRTTRSLSPTPEGERLAREGGLALKGLREVLREFEAAAEAGRNRVVTAATPMLAATVLPQVIAAYRGRHPDVEIVLRDRPYEQVVSAIVDREADIGITALDGPQKNVRFQLLAEEDMVLVLPARHPLSRSKHVRLAQIMPHPIMFLERYSELRTRLQAEYAKADVPFQPVLATTLPMLLGMIDAGNCITFLPRSMAQANAKRTRTTRLVEDFASTRRYGSVVARKASPNSATMSFHRFLRQSFKEVLEGRQAG